MMKNGCTRRKCRCFARNKCGGQLELALFAFVAITFAASGRSADEADDLAARINHRIAERWRDREIHPAPLSSDAEFMRRIWLDVAGRIPTAGQARAFLEETSADKRRRLIEQLLDSGASVGHFTRTWREAWLPKQDGDRYPTYAARFDNFLRDRLRRNTPYDQIVREILTSPSEDSQAKSPVDQLNTSPTLIGFFEANERRPDAIATAAAKGFLALRVDCAQCHDHPFGQWTRRQFWEFAAFFSKDRTGREPSIQVPELGTAVSARFLDGESPVWDVNHEPDERTSREALAQWMTLPDNPFFAKAAVNRIWAHCFGVGLVEPVDDMNTSNSPSHPELLNELARAFIEHGYDLKFLLRGILRSHAYSLTSRRTHESQDNASDFARMPVKALTGQQLFDSVVRAAGYPPAGPRAALRDPQVLRAEFLARFASTERSVDATTSIPQALVRMNGSLTMSATDSASSPLLVVLRDAPHLTDRQRVEELFLATLSRLPNADEFSHFTDYISSGDARKDPSSALADVFWALLNSHEFSVNH